MNIKKSMISSVLALALASSITGCGGSAGEKTGGGEIVIDKPSDDKKKEQIQSQSVVNGIVDIGGGELENKSAKSSRSSITTFATKPNCGKGADVQLYAIDDVDYENPLLKEPFVIQEGECSFDIKTDLFKDPSLGGDDKKYIIRTVVKQEDGKKLELAATKLKSGSQSTKVDPIATLLKTKFVETIKETKKSLEKLKEYGVDDAAIEASLEEIMKSFEKNMDETVQTLKKDIEAGKIQIDTQDFETEVEIDAVESEEQKAKREEKEEKLKEKVENSSAKDNFEAIENVAKQDRMDKVTRSLGDDLKKQLKGKMSEPVAQMKYGIIESFVKIGLPVHDGNGNLIIFLPVDPKEKGKLPGYEFKLKYYDNNGSVVGTVGNDFAIRVVDPQKDLSNASGNELWLNEFRSDAPKIPNSVIDEFIINKDHTVTLKDLGMMLDEISGGDGTHEKLSGLYSVKLSANVDKASNAILDVYKDEFLKRNYDEVFYEQLDQIFSNTPDKAVEKILELAFIVKDGESKEEFEERITQNKRVMGYIRDSIGQSLANSIPPSDDEGVMQFKDGFTINADTKLKPLTSLALVNLYMNIYDERATEFKEVLLSDEFGWLDQEGVFGDKKIWMLRDSELAALADEEAEQTLDEEANFQKDIIIQIVKKITGIDSINVERGFDDMVKSLNVTLKIIDEKQIQAQKANVNKFEQEFKEDTITFDPSASVSFEVKDFDDKVVSDLNLSLIPILENINTYERVPMEHLAIPVTKGDRYSVSDLTLIDPEKVLNKDAQEDKEGEYRATFDYQLVIVDGDDKKAIATFPIFPGENYLGAPFIYDTKIDYANTTEFIEPDYNAGEEDPMGMVLDDQNFLDFTNDMDIFVPFIIKTNGDMVGENILHFDASTKTLSVADKKGVVSDAIISMTILAPDYDYKGMPIDADKLIIGGNIKEGALISVKLSGPQIQDQKINLEVMYMDEDGVQIRFYSDMAEAVTPPPSGEEGSESMENPLIGMLKDRFYREDSFTLVKSSAQTRGTFNDITINDDATITFENVRYEYIYDDFDSITMKDITSGEYVTFKFIKDEFKKADVVVAEADIAGKEMVFADEMIAIKITFNQDGSYRRVTKSTFGDFTYESGGNWSINEGIITLDGESLVVSKSENQTLDLGDKVLFADFEGGYMNPHSPDHEVKYLGDPRDDKASFDGLVKEKNYFITPAVSGNDLVSLMGGKTFYVAHHGDTSVESMVFNANLTTLTTQEGEVIPLAMTKKGVEDKYGEHIIIDVTNDFIVVATIRDDGSYDESLLYFDRQKVEDELGISHDKKEDDKQDSEEGSEQSDGGNKQLVPAIQTPVVTGDDLKDLLSGKIFFSGYLEGENSVSIDRLTFDQALKVLKIETIEGEEDNETILINMKEDGFEASKEDDGEDNDPAFIEVIDENSDFITIQIVVHNELDSVEKLYFNEQKARENHDSSIYEREYEGHNDGVNPDENDQVDSEDKNSSTTHTDNDIPRPDIQPAILFGDNLKDYLRNKSFYNGFREWDGSTVLEKLTFNQALDTVAIEVIEGEVDDDDAIAVEMVESGFKIPSENGGFELIEIIEITEDYMIVQSLNPDNQVIDVEKFYTTKEKAQERYDSSIYEEHHEDNQSGGDSAPAGPTPVVSGDDLVTLMTSGTFYIPDYENQRVVSVYFSGDFATVSFSSGENEQAIESQVERTDRGMRYLGIEHIVVEDNDDFIVVLDLAENGEVIHDAKFFKSQQQAEGQISNQETTQQEDPNAPDIQKPVVIGDELKSLLSAATFYSAAVYDGENELEKLLFSQDLRTLSFEVLEGDDENNTIKIEMLEDGIKVLPRDGEGEEIVQVIENSLDFIVIQIISEGKVVSVEKLYKNQDMAVSNYDSNIYEAPENHDEISTVDWYYHSSAEGSVHDVVSLKNFWIDQGNNSGYTDFKYLPSISQDTSATSGSLSMVGDGVISDLQSDIVGEWHLVDYNNDSNYDAIVFNTDGGIEEYFFENGSLIRKVSN